MSLELGIVLHQVPLICKGEKREKGTFIYSNVPKNNSTGYYIGLIYKIEQVNS